ncbi:hypothetical protein NPIL_281701 [Nephila pilipes]|uniref:Uncharacterized protein n=1 Tax=Nephila pilipes TaxID=299642 RepID=A0A8X6NM40_NEPPI|nr:hypothetical protein NPIL_281701 [Nephila pilipes]
MSIEEDINIQEQFSGFLQIKKINKATTFPFLTSRAKKLRIIFVKVQCQGEWGEYERWTYGGKRRLETSNLVLFVLCGYYSIYRAMKGMAKSSSEGESFVNLGYSRFCLD